MKTETKEVSAWVQGYCAALGNIAYVDGSGVRIDEALEAAGIASVKELRKHKVSDFDIKILKSSIKEIQRRNKR